MTARGEPLKEPAPAPGAERLQAAGGRRPRVRWRIALLLAVTLAIVSVLLFARVSTTEIELDVSASEVSFRSPRQQVLTNVLKLSSLGASGLQAIQLPASEGHPARVLRASDGSGSGIRLSAALDDPRGGSVSLAALTLPAETRIWLRPTEVAGEYRMSLQGPGLALRADVLGPVEVGLSGAPAEQHRFASPKPIRLQSDSGELDLDLRLATASKNVFSSELSANNLSFFRVEEVLDAERSMVRRVSTIVSGTLYFESLGGQERRLRPGENIRFETSQGQIRTLRLRDDQIELAFHGRVGGMASGSEESNRSLMPTYLEWLRARHGLSLLWGTTLYLFGLAAAALRWWEGKG